MNIDINPLYAPIFESNCRYFHLWGGRSRGASHFATDYFLWKMTQPTYFRGAMLRATMNQITKTLWPALMDRLKTAVDNGDLFFDDFKINISDHTVQFLPTKNSILCQGFRKVSSSSKADLKGLEGMTHAIVEEAEDVGEDDFDELDATFRTTKVKNIQIFVLFNPPGKNHWLIKNNYDLIPCTQQDKKGWYSAIQKTGNSELLAIHSTYLDNLANVNEGTKRFFKNKGDILHPAYNLDYYNRSVLGLISEGKRGRIFLKVKSISKELYNQLPYEKFYGLDFGYNDPVAVCECKYHNNKLFARQVIYEKGLENDGLAKEIKRNDISRTDKIYADSAEPKSIATLCRYGLLVIPTIKGADSIEYGYRELLNVQIYIVNESEGNKDFWYEIEEHCWDLDADKNPTDKPEDSNNHLIDALRYAYTMHVSRKNMGGVRSELGQDYPSSHNGRISQAALLDSIGKERRDIAKGLDDDDIEDYYEDLGYGETKW